jgi:hypothetical protein
VCVEFEVVRGTDGGMLGRTVMCELLGKQGYVNSNASEHTHTITWKYVHFSTLNIYTVPRYLVVLASTEVE